jgi:hypothetical protein
MQSFWLLPLLVALLSCYVQASSNNVASLQGYLQNEALLLSEAQQQVGRFLMSKNIPIKSLLLSREERRRLAEESKKHKSRVCESTEDNEVECRISLDRVDFGRKCIAPCGCVGSQRWIQFSEFNRLRRKEPTKWVTCQTCQQPFDYSIINQQPVDMKTVVLTTMLDKSVIVRSVMALMVAMASYIFSVDKLLLRLVTSRFFWQRVSNTLSVHDHATVMRCHLWCGLFLPSYTPTSLKLTSLLLFRLLILNKTVPPHKQARAFTPRFKALGWPSGTAVPVSILWEV